MKNSSIRCYGADLLKILAMYMIVILHVLGQGGILAAASSGSAQYYVAWYMEGAAFCAVNCFAIVSGYVQNKNTTLRLKRLFILWFQVVSLSCGISLIFYLSGNAVMDITNIRKSLLPLLSNNYWYFTAYFFLFLLIPYINKGLLNTTLREHRTLAAIVVVIICMSNIGSVLFESQVLKLNQGYSFLWIAFMYVIGTWLKRDEALLSRVKAPVWAILFALFAALAVFDKTKGWQLGFLNYTSPAILGAAICLSELMFKIKVSSAKHRRRIITVSKLSFGVYIIHCHWLIWEHVLFDTFARYAQLNPAVMAFAVLGSAAVIYLICTAADYVRDKIFSIVPFLHE